MLYFAAFEPTCTAIRGWPRCRTWAAVGVTAAPSCNRLRTDRAATAAMLVRGPGIPRETFSSARNRYFSEQFCDEVPL